jgi:hypothetical protein
VRRRAEFTRAVARRPRRGSAPPLSAPE